MIAYKLYGQCVMTDNETMIMRVENVNEVSIHVGMY